MCLLYHCSEPKVSITDVVSVERMNDLLVLATLRSCVVVCVDVQCILRGQSQQVTGPVWLAL